MKDDALRLLLLSVLPSIEASNMVLSNDCSPDSLLLESIIALFSTMMASITPPGLLDGCSEMKVQC